MTLGAGSCLMFSLFPDCYGKLHLLLYDSLTSIVGRIVVPAHSMFVFIGRVSSSLFFILSHAVLLPSSGSLWLLLLYPMMDADCRLVRWEAELLQGAAESRRNIVYLLYMWRGGSLFHPWSYVVIFPSARYCTNLNFKRPRFDPKRHTVTAQRKLLNKKQLLQTDKTLYLQTKNDGIF